MNGKKYSKKMNHKEYDFKVSVPYLGDIRQLRKCVFLAQNYLHTFINLYGLHSDESVTLVSKTEN